MSDQEIEIAFIVIDPEPQLMFEELFSIEGVGEFDFGPPSTVDLRDVYFDTPTEVLRSTKNALRIRMGPKTWIAVKGPSLNGHRMEIEEEWPDGASRILSWLDGAGIPASFPGDMPTPPLEAMLSLGLKVIHDRSNHRIVRDIRVSGERVGELALDSITYRIQGVDVSHFEVEIEMHGDDAVKHLDALVPIVKQLYEGRLHHGNTSKLGIGLALDRLAAEGKLSEVVRDTGAIRQDAYSRLIQQ